MPGLLAAALESGDGIVAVSAVFVREPHDVLVIQPFTGREETDTRLQMTRVKC